ncbi:MAG TPA: winged helix-turn-helix domain-containing protein [Nitrososphaerales archaeon]|nr:winged helix-turn-helix domain-containing protein [Nitrososphaerales archaeon]
MAQDLELKRVLWYVLGGARGGQNRARIIHELVQRPLNMNQLAEKLGVDYRTVMHHTSVLRTNSLIESREDKYGAMLFLTQRLQAGIELFDEIVRALKYSLE